MAEASLSANVIPADSGISGAEDGIPAFAGMTLRLAMGLCR